MMEKYGRSGRNRVVIPSAGGTAEKDKLFDEADLLLLQGIAGLLHIINPDMYAETDLLIEVENDLDLTVGADVRLYLKDVSGGTSGYFTFSSGDTIDMDSADEFTIYAGATAYIGAAAFVRLNGATGCKIHHLKSGATQALAGAAIEELWVTSGHASLPDNVVMIGV
jgi:hypothetical protein